MSKFLKYQHLERFGTQSTEGILDGLVYVFPKIDGTNGSIWSNDGIVHCGSRNRELELTADNAGFMRETVSDARYLKFFEANPDLRLYGEWLVPHSLKTYQDDAWRKFYVFDVTSGDTEENVSYLKYEDYQRILEVFGIEYIPPINIIKNANEESLFKSLDKCGQYLVKNGEGIGEGIVIKNYEYKNRYGRQTWAKIITSEFKTVHHKEMGAPIVTGSKLVEEAIVHDYVTEAYIEKEKAKLITENNGVWENKLIPKLLGVVYYELIREEMWNTLKKHKEPKINFKPLQKMVNDKTKKVIGL